MKRASAIAWSLTCLCACLMLSCAGYTLRPVKPVRFATVKTLYVPTFKNQTLEPRSSVLVTNSVIQQFQRDGTYKLVPSRGADAILEAKITRLRRHQTRSTRFNTLRARELEFTLEVEYRLRDLRTNELLDEGKVSGRTSQFLDPNFQLSERQALPAAAERVAQELVSRLAEGW